MQTETVKNQKAIFGANALRVEEVLNKKQIKEFIELPRKLYPDKNSLYVMPLEAHIKMMMGKPGTPQKHFFIAYKGTEPVARLGIKVHAVGHETRLHFGFYECDPKHPDATKALIEKAHSMYPHLEMMGPFNFRQEDPYIGVLVEGYDQEPYFMMSYNHKQYNQMLTDSGMTKAMDLFTYILKNPAHYKDAELPQLIKDNSQRARTKLGLTFRQLNPKNLRQEARIIAGIFNEALKDNWGFEEFLESQIDEMVLMFKFFIDPRIVIFAMHEGKEVGCLIVIPNYNHVIKPSYGKINLGLLKRYFGRTKTTNSIRGYALGVLKKYHSQGVGSAILEEIYKIGAQTKYADCEISWVLANNGPMNELSQAMGGKHNKVYRIYKKDPLSQKVN